MMVNLLLLIYRFSGRITTHNTIIINDHASEVAGLIVANCNNGEGIAGINWYAHLNSYSFTDPEEDWDDRIRQAISDGNKIINISQGHVNDVPDVKFELAKAYNNNVIIIHAMGNNGIHGYPAESPAVISVGSSTKSNTRSSFSNTGNFIEFLAPGGEGVQGSDDRNILSTASSGYKYTSGTSFSAPIVTGAASLLLAKRNDLYNDDIKNLFIISCDKLAEMNGQNFTNEHGYGRINVKRALDFLQLPYQLNNTLTSTGGTDMGAGNLETISIFGAEGLGSGVYYVKKHEVRKTVYFDHTNNPYVWTRGAASKGWSQANPILNQNFCEVIPGTVTSTSAELRTYVYEVWNVSLTQSYGYYPSTPQNVIFAFSVLGIPGSLSGPITSNTTWSGTVIVGGNITVNSGVTLSVSSGSNITFQNGSSLSVNGTLNASNATFDWAGSTKWNGIKFNSGSSGSLSYCTIKNVNWGVECTSVMPSITNCRFEYYNIGLKLNNVGTPTAHLSGNSFYGSTGGTGQGIACYYSSPYIDNGSYFYFNNNGIFGVGSCQMFQIVYLQIMDMGCFW